MRSMTLNGSSRRERRSKSQATEEEAVREAHDKARWAVTGWKVMSELPNPVNFEAASATVREEDIREQFACGPDVERHVATVAPYIDAGYDHVYVHQVGPDRPEAFDFFREEILPEVR